jgi:pyruvate/2-oxoglutarate dehydrogenase complex dihydrolipoamide acyltransferase (E2) component
MSNGETENGEERPSFNPQDDAIAAGEHIPEDTLELSGQAGQGGAPFPSPQLAQPSALMNPYLSEEDQFMEMEAQVMGPPQYGSPDPATAAGRLLPLDQHPLNAEALPEGHPAAISEDYGEGYAGTVIAGVPQRTDLENALAGQSAAANEEANASDAAKTLANENNVDLSEVEGTGSGGSITKSDVQNYIDERDSTS